MLWHWAEKKNTRGNVKQKEEFGRTHNCFCRKKNKL
jgi:hypothetical protein